MKIIEDFPPNYAEITKTFDIDGKSIVFTYGDTIYNPRKAKIQPHLERHESIHWEQQQKYGGPEKWWERYLIDNKFRLEQEIEAYAAQYKFVQEEMAVPRQAKRRFLLQICKDVSGPIYGHCISFERAKQLITNK